MIIRAAGGRIALEVQGQVAQRHCEFKHYQQSRDGVPTGFFWMDAAAVEEAAATGATTIHLICKTTRTVWNYDIEAALGTFPRSTKFQYESILFRQADAR